MSTKQAPAAQAFIVTLCYKGGQRPNYGPFIWRNEVLGGRYVWRNEVATSMGQLAELMNQACKFMRGKGTSSHEIIASEVPLEQVMKLPEAEKLRPQIALDTTALEKENEELRSLNTSLKQSNEELLKLVERIPLPEGVKPPEPPDNYIAPAKPRAQAPAAETTQTKPAKPDRRKSIRAGKAGSKVGCISHKRRQQPQPEEATAGAGAT